MTTMSADMLGVVLLSMITIVLFCYSKNIFVQHLFKWSKCPDKSAAWFLIAFLGVLLYIFYSQVFLKKIDKSEYDFLGRKEKIGWFRNWEWTHFILYFIYAFICPGDWVFVFFIGLFFEFLELSIGIFTKNDKYWTSNSDSLIAWGDIGANLSGYALGTIVHKVFSG